MLRESFDGLPTLFAGPFVDAVAAGPIQNCISRLLEQGRRQILVDLSEVSAMDLTCIDELERAFSKVAGSGGAIKLMNVTKRIGAFRLDGITKLLTGVRDLRMRI